MSDDDTLRTAEPAKLQLRVQIPPRELDALVQCEATPAAVERWISELRLTNLGPSARDVFDLLEALARLRCDGALRMELLEQLRPVVGHLERLLARQFLNRQVLLDEQEQRAARLAGALVRALAMGYKVVFVDALRAGDEPLMLTAIHRAVSELAKLLLRRCQLYAPVTERLWLDLHQLYGVAEAKRIQHQPVTDPIEPASDGSTIATAWARSILLWCADPNKLRQKDIGHIFHCLQFWAPRLAVGPASADGIFIVNLAADRGPSYKSFYMDEPDALCRSLDPGALVTALEQVRDENTPQAVLPETGDLRQELLDHLLRAWGVMMERNHARANADGVIEVCIGMRALHHHASDGRSFDRQLFGASAGLRRRETNPFLVDHRKERSRDKDVWANAFDVGRAVIPENAAIADPARSLYVDSEQQEDTGSSAELPTYRTRIVDMSPGGYCLRWLTPVPSNLQTGEVVGIRNDTNQPWYAAVVRWIRTDRNGVTQMGLEVLAPGLTPVGARVIYKKGGPSEYMRGFLLDANRMKQRPRLLLAPKLPFQPGQKAHINRNGDERRAQLRERHMQTDSFQLLGYRMLDEPEQLDTRVDFDVPDLSP